MNHSCPNPWLSIPPSDYESHISSPDVMQAQMIAGLLAEAVRDTAVRVDRVLREDAPPLRIAVLGASTGNGFAVFDGADAEVHAVDINPAYLDVLHQRYAERLSGLVCHACDLASEPVPVAGCDLIFAALIFEYVPMDTLIASIADALAPGGVCHVLLQLPSASDVTPTRYSSLKTLASCMQLVDPDALITAAEKHGLGLRTREEIRSRPEKRFAHLELTKSAHGS